MITFAALSLIASSSCSEGTTSPAPPEPPDSAVLAGADTAVAPSSDTGEGGSSTAASCPQVTALTAETGPLQRLDVVLSVSADLETAIWAVCEADDDPTERLLYESAERSTEHSVTLHGLAPERAYTCAVHTDCSEASPASVAYLSPPLPADVSTFTVSDGAPERWGAYNLFPEIEPCSDYDHASAHVLVVDMEGRPRWLYEIPEAIISSDVDVRYLEEGWIHIAGGWGTFDLDAPHRGMFRTLDLSGGVIYDRSEPAVGLGFNHHSERLDTGEFLSLTYGLFEDRYVGITVEVWDPATDELTWSWDSEAILSSGTGPAQPGNLWVANSVSFVEDELGSAMYLSVVTTDTLWRIDRETGALTHIIGRGEGWALVNTAGEPLGSEDWFYFQHNPEYRDGRVLMHDNGQGRPGGGYTRAVEFEVDLQNQILTQVWSWSEPDWYNPYLGDADRLPNGNILIGTGHIWCLSSQDDVSSLIEVDPDSGEIAWRMDWDSGDYATYRVERLDGCEIFSNAKYCPAVADRISALEAGVGSPGR